MSALITTCASETVVLADYCVPRNEAERRHIEAHKYFLSQKRGYDVGWECASADWFERYAQRYREWRQRRMLERQAEQIYKHKFLRSIEEQRDLGMTAKFEWVSLYAASWREWYEREYYDHDDLNEGEVLDFDRL